MPRVDMLHRRRRVEELTERAPALIDLPFTLPSIPLLDPILTPLIDGPSPTSSTKASSPPTTPASQPTTATQGASPTQTPTTTTQPSNPQSPTTSPNASPTNGDGGGGGNGSTASDGSDPEPSGSSPSSSEDNPAGSTPSSGSSPSDNLSSVSGITVRPDGALITISGDAHALIPSQSGSAGQETGGNASPNGATQVSIPGYSGSASVTMTGSLTGGTGTAGSTDTNSENPSQPGSTHHGMTGGVLAAIITVSVLLLLVLLLCCIRRRSLAARIRRRREWFAGGATQDMGYADRESASARSSFATNYDHGPVAVTLPPYDAPSMHSTQTMQQIWPSDLSGSVVAVPPVSHAVESSSSPTIRVTGDRSSIHSASSGSPSRPTSQASLPYLVVPPPAAEASPTLSPLSVRPTTPTESWWFPKSPKEDSNVGIVHLIRTGSVTSSIQSRDTTFHAENPQNILVAAENPFAEPEDPFADPGSAAWPESPTVPSFPAVETVRHSFMPSMPDEMAITVGDKVRVIHGFDDGWATVQNVGTGAQGLVPLDRMREEGKEGAVPAFIAKKRVSSCVRPRDSAQTRASFLSGASTVGAAI